MSQFDFPKINFHGSAIINPATGNNNLWLPLVLFDYIQIKAIIPPRIYISSDIEMALAIKAIELPQNCDVLVDENDQKYFEISPINTADKIKSWACTPLGNSSLDASFHPIYGLIKLQRGNGFLKGKIPGGWNYFGGMEFEFEKVSPCSIEVLNSDLDKKTYLNTSDDCPESIQKILNSNIDFLNKKGKNSAVMIDVSPGLTFSTQVFCDCFNLHIGNETLISGKPGKATLRHINPHRIVNQKDAVGSSGTFYCTISLENLELESRNFILDFYSTYGVDISDLKGIFIRYNLFEVYENLNPDYSDKKNLQNPARSSVTGSISPWLHDDNKSITMARLMVPENPFLHEKTISNFVFKLDESRNKICLDLIGSIPEILHEQTKEYQTFPLGELSFRCNSNEGEVELAKLTVNEDRLGRDQLIKSGGIIEIPISEPNLKLLKQGPMSIYGNSIKADKSSVTLLMTESEYMVATDTSGVYIDQFDNPADGYISYNQSKEPCKISIFRYGQPVEDPIPMFIKEYRIKSSLAEAETSTFLLTDNFTSKTELIFDTHKAANNMYVLYPGSVKPDNKNPIPDVIKYGFIINLRVLPTRDYGKYLNVEHSEYPCPITFELIYKELLEVSDIIYPLSSMVTPFNKPHFQKAWDFIKKRLEPGNWDSYSYMPSSRDMSKSLFQLINKWAENRNVRHADSDGYREKSLPKSRKK
jgi:hypothetical protein